ncbi:hypothetical protein [Bacillus sp. NPDC077027]|uniref:hypothetical protein n=1 Tax=Bacillus sp. NPDC077027 TaxID=3390548 RepID=UPI003D06D413
MKIDDSILSLCLFYTSNRFARYMTKMAEDASKETDLSPTYIYLLIVIQLSPGMTALTEVF